METIRFRDMGSVDLSAVLFSVTSKQDTPYSKARKFVDKICPNVFKKSPFYKRRIRSEKKIPDFYPKIYYAGMKYNSKWSDKDLVEAEIKRLDECEPQIYQLWVRMENE